MLSVHGTMHMIAHTRAPLLRLQLCSTGLVCVSAVMLIVFYAGKKWHWRGLLLCVVAGLLAWAALNYALCTVYQASPAPMPTFVLRGSVNILMSPDPQEAVLDTLATAPTEEHRFYVVARSFSQLHWSDDLVPPDVLIPLHMARRGDHWLCRGTTPELQQWIYLYNRNRKKALGTMVSLMRDTFAGLAGTAERGSDMLTRVLGQVFTPDHIDGSNRMITDHMLLWLDVVLTVSMLMLDAKQTRADPVTMHVLVSGPFHSHVVHLALKSNFETVTERNLKSY
jgi:hypothetical protein